MARSEAVSGPGTAGAVETEPASARAGLGGRYARLWTASTLSAVGDGMSLTAAPLLAYTLTDDPRLVAGVTTALTLPYVLFGLPAGVLVDRVDLLRAMRGIDLFRGLLLLTLAVAVALDRGNLLVLYICFFLIGTCETFFRNASQVIVPSVVPRKLLVDANGRLLAAQTAGNEFVGPLLGSVLFAIAAAVPFGIDAASFLLSALLLSSLLGVRSAKPSTRRTGGPSTSERPADLPAAPGSGVDSAGPVSATRPGLLADMTTGARWLLRDRLLRGLALAAGGINLVLTAGLAVMVVHAHTVLGLGSIGYGLLLACQAVGAVFAARLAPRLVRRLGDEQALVCVAATMAAANVAVWLVPVGTGVGLALAAAACAGVTWDVVVVALRQTRIPRPLQGRVNSVYRLVAWGAMPVGAALGGLLSTAFGTPSVFAAGAVLMTMIAACLAEGARRRWISDPR